MTEEKHSIGLEVVLLALAVIGARLLLYEHNRQAYSEPQKTVGLLMKAAGSADLAGFQQASMPTYYAAFVRHFGEAKYHRVQNIYQLVFRMGGPRWAEYRQRADAAADNVYQRLHEKVTLLGRESFGRVSVEERMRLMDDRSKYNAFLFDQGIQALPAEERSRIDNVQDFREYRDRPRFVEREAWNVLPSEDRTALGSPAVLSRGMTPEKLAFIDRMGVQLLGKEEKKEIEGIQRSELSDPPAFKFKYGEPLAKDYLVVAKIPQPLRIQPCSFVREDVGGSLLRGNTAVCAVTFQAGERTVTSSVTLRKLDFAWLVESVQPALYEISWQVPHE